MKKSIWISLFALLVVACSGGGEDPVVSKDYINVTPDEIRLSADGGEEKSITISANCRWTITKSVSSEWLIVSDPSGSNDGVIKVKARDKNSTGSERQATLTFVGANVHSRPIMVYQEKETEVVSLSVDVSSLSFEAKGESKTFTITSNTNWSITKPDWCTISKTSGTGNSSITVTASENPNQEQRSGQIVISGDNVANSTIAVSQKAQSSLSVNVSSLSFEAKGESKTFTISSNTNWTITKPEWCTISQSSGSGNATITVTASENPNQEQRTGQIVISGDNVTDATIAVSQKAKESSDNQEPGKNDNQPPT